MRILLSRSLNSLILMLSRRLVVRNEPQHFVIWDLLGFALLTTSLQSHLMQGSIA